jgi:acyl dehydratase
VKRSVSREGLRRWAALSGDANPIHVDEAYAATTRYGSTIAHGHLVLTWLVAHANANAPGWQRIEGLRFRRPVLPDQEYDVSGDPLMTVTGQDGEVCVEATLIR